MVTRQENAGLVEQPNGDLEQVVHVTPTELSKSDHFFFPLPLDLHLGGKRLRSAKLSDYHIMNHTI